MNGTMAEGHNGRSSPGGVGHGNSNGNGNGNLSASTPVGDVKSGDRSPDAGGVQKTDGRTDMLSGKVGYNSSSEDRRALNVLDKGFR